MPLLSFENLSIGYENNVILENLSFAKIDFMTKMEHFISVF